MNHAFKFAITSAAAAWMIVSAGGTVAKAADEADTTRPTAQAKPDPLPFRWFFEFGNDVSSDKALADILKHVDMAAEHGFNGMVWEGNFVGMDQWPKANLERLAKLKEHCDARKVEVIPLMMTAGYDGGITAVNQNLLEGLAAKDMLFEVKGGLATCAGEDRPLSVEDGGFETAKGDAAAGFIAQANPGKVSFVDRNVFKEGKASLRFENPSGKRASVTLPPLTKPYKYYALRFWAKAENLKPATISVCIYQDGFQTNRVDFKPTDKWQQFDCTVFTQDAKETQVHVGSWSAKTGKFWIDGIELFEPGLVNVLRRPGTPVLVKKDGGGEAFTEGKDYEKIMDPKFKPAQAYHEPPAIKIIPGGKIQDGDRLRVSFFAPQFLRKGQRVICMSEPQVFDIWGKAIAEVQKALHPNIWFLDMDEIRGGGTCQACQDRKNAKGEKMSSGEILGDCITHQVKLIREGNPKAEVAVWGDMLDPLEGAGAKYFNVPGGYGGSWNHVPKDLIMVPWIFGHAKESIQHFDRLGFRTVGGAYYEDDTLESSKSFLKEILAAPKGSGLLYTTWEKKYDSLAPFGDAFFGVKGK